MKTLREQVWDIGARWVNPEWATAMGFGRLVNELAVRAFHMQKPECVETRAIRRALDLIGTPGWVTEQEPGVSE